MVKKKVFRVMILFVHGSTAPISMTIGEADSLSLQNSTELITRHDDGYCQDTDHSS